MPLTDASDNFHKFTMLFTCSLHATWQQLAFQFSIWDRIKDIESLTKQQSARFAQFIINLITHAALPISVLKVVKFSDLEERLLRLVRQILLGLLLSKEDIFKEVKIHHNSHFLLLLLCLAIRNLNHHSGISIQYVLQVFQRIVSGAQLKPFKESLRLFMHHFMLKDGANRASVGEGKMALLKDRIKMADKFLDTSSLSF